MPTGWAAKTVVRTGFGLFAGFLGERRGDVLQNGFTQNTNMVLTNNNGLPGSFLTTLANPFPNGVSEPRGAADGYKTYLGQGFSFFNQNPKVPTTMRWELSLQREAKGFVFEANYIGSKTSHVEVTRNINALPLQYWSTLGTRDEHVNNYLSASIANPMYGLLAGNTQGTYTSTTISRQALLSPYAAFGTNAINGSENIGYGWYHGFSTSGQKRFSKGFTLQGSYTFSKWQQAINLLNPVDPRPVREISDADAPHRFNVNGVWELPFGNGKALLSSSNALVSGSWADGSFPASGAYRAASRCPGAT